MKIKFHQPFCIEPPIQPVLPQITEQSVNSWTDKSNNTPYLIIYCALKASAAENPQHVLKWNNHKYKNKK